MNARGWLWTLTVLLIIVLAALLGPGMSAWARPGQFAQTVPTPTPTGVPQPLPTATPSRPTPPPPTAVPTPPSQMETPTPPVSAPSSPPLAIPGVDMNVRAEPGTDAAIVGTAYAGRTYAITGRNPAGDWWRIDYDGQVGWLYAPLVETEGDVSQVPIIIQAQLTGAVSTETPVPSPTPTVPPILSLDITADPPWGIPGRRVSFQVTVSNAGPADATDVVVRDELPAMIVPDTVRGPRGEASLDGQIVLIHLGRLASGDSVTLTIEGSIQPGAPAGEIIDNILEVSSAEGVRVSSGVSVPLPPEELPPTGGNVFCLE